MSNPSGSTFPENTLPTYNVKNNPSVFNFKGNSITRLNYIRQVLLAISFNQDFLLRVLDFRNMGRAYYNANPKRFCSTVRLGGVETLIGTLKMEGDFTTSNWGDKNMFFQHQIINEDEKVHPEWEPYYARYSLIGNCPYQNMLKNLNLY